MASPLLAILECEVQEQSPLEASSSRTPVLASWLGTVLGFTGSHRLVLTLCLLCPRAGLAVTAREGCLARLAPR